MLRFEHGSKSNFELEEMLKNRDTTLCDAKDHLLRAQAATKNGIYNLLVISINGIYNLLLDRWFFLGYGLTVKRPSPRPFAKSLQQNIMVLFRQ